ncbi:ceramide-1-phosphate transfer protein-like [Gordionus sp. m RMFG-2023]|uniref:ceramide-1-phosphate transfer protein-like n=1 Tax=Gordionus sp. m RMFG-2023 TaxID=3053472 RepID=UPI0031FC35AB
MSEDPSNDKKFNLQLLETKLKTCNENKDIELKSYIEAYQEIQKFFPLLGKIFYFIYTDVQKKLTILNNFTLDTNKSGIYKTVLSMVRYEVTLLKEPINEYIIINDAAIGCRTFSRLHRAFNFFINFLEGIVNKQQILNNENFTNNNMDYKLSSIAIESYNLTLSQFHPWIIKKAVQVAVHSLPTKK